jgi:putative ABC transport system substrate-binding protein
VKAARRVLLVLAWLVPPAGAAEVVLLKSSDVPAWRPTLEALKAALPDHQVAEHDLGGERAEGLRVLSGLKAHPVILVAVGALAAQLAREVLPEAPLVFCMVPAPEKLGLLGQPAVGGVAFQTPARNQLVVFRFVNPRATRIGVLYDPEASGKLVAEAQAAAGPLGLTLVARPLGGEREVPQGLRALLQGEKAVDALWIPPDPLLLSDETRRFLLAETLKAGKPTYGFSVSLVQEGALLSGGPSFVSIGELAGGLVHRLARGERRMELMVPAAELAINTRIAEKLRISISSQALKEARRKF